MRSTKTELKFFTIPEWQKEEAYLREQHQNGWKLVNITAIGLYHFQKCEPADVIYQLDYNTNTDEYFQIFEDCGWEYLQTYVGYSYFRKPVSDMNGTQEEIFCDDTSRLDFMKRVFKGRMVPMLIIFFLVLIPQIIMQALRQEYGLMILFCILLGIYLGIFISFAVSYWKYRNSVYKE